MQLLSKILVMIWGIFGVLNVTVSMDDFTYRQNITCRNDIWYITLPTKNITVQFTSNQISNIIMSCFSEQEQAQILNGRFDLLALRVEKFDIRPDCVPKVFVELSSLGNKNNKHSVDQFQKVVSRVRENLGILGHSEKLQHAFNCSSVGLYQLQLQADIAGIKKMVESLKNEKPWTREGRDTVRKLLAQAKAILESPITHKLHQIKTADLATAQALLNQLNNQWPWCLDCRFPQNFAQVQQYVNQMGINELGAAQKLFYSRADYRQQHVLQALQQHQNKLQLLPAHSTHEQLVERHKAGDMASLQQEYDNLTKHLHSASSTADGARLQQQLKSLHDRMYHPVTNSLSEIKITKDLNGALEQYHTVLQSYDPDMQKTLGFCPIEAAKSLLEARTDYQALQAEPYDEFMVTELDVQILKPINVQQEIIHSLEMYPDRTMLAHRLEEITADVFCNVYHSYDIFPEIKTHIHTSIDTIKSTTNPCEFAFHMTVVDHVLSDMQTQAGHDQSTLQKSSQVLTRAIKQYWKNLSPTETEISFVSDLARYVSDVTLGTSYLSPEMREQRIQAFWNTVDTISSVSLSDVTLENIVDGSMYIAARATWAMGIGQVISVIKNVKNACFLSQTVASCANKFLGAFESILGGSPLIGADGTAIGSVSSALAADVVKVVAIATTHEQAEQIPILFHAQDQEPQKK